MKKNYVEEDKEEIVSMIRKRRSFKKEKRKVEVKRRIKTDKRVKTKGQKYKE